MLIIVSRTRPLAQPNLPLARSSHGSTTSLYEADEIDNFRGFTQLGDREETDPV